MLEEDLTPGEKLYLWRRRKNKRVWEYARQYGVSRYAYQRWENDLGDDIPIIKLMGVEQAEQFVILRKRSGMTQKELAARMGISRSWLHLVEAGKVSMKQAIEFWC